LLGFECRGTASAIGKSYVSRILRLALIAPSVVEEILDGRADLPLMLEKLERLPAQLGRAAR
jgi:hypothetical protein